jgi:hypothetical protein
MPPNVIFATTSSTLSSQNLLPSILYFITAFFYFQAGPQEIRAGMCWDGIVEA